jgi:hypothetical protein
MQCTITQHRGAFGGPLLLWKRNEYYANECVFVALGIQHAMRMHHIALWALPCSTIFFHILS